MDSQKVSIVVLNELSEVLKKVPNATTETFLTTIKKAPAIFVAGMGRSGYMARAFTMRLMHLGLVAHFVGDTTTTTIKEGDLLIICSGSGETKSLVNFAEKATKLGAKLALVTINPESTIAKLAEAVVELQAPVVKTSQQRLSEGSQPLGNLFEQSLLLYLDICSTILMEELGESPESMMLRHTNLE